MQLLLNTLFTLSIYSLIALGFYLTYKTQKFINFGHGISIALGGYILYILSSSVFGLGLPGLILSLIGAVLVSGLAAAVLDQTLYCYLRIKKQSALMLLVVSLGITTMGQSALALAFTSQYKIVDSIGIFSQTIMIRGAAITVIQLVAIILAAIAALSIITVIAKTKFGRAFRALADDVEVSAIVGVPVERVHAKITFLAGALAGLGGALIAIDTGIYPTMGFLLLLKSIIVSIIGGLTVISGPIVGAVIVSFLENGITINYGAEWRDISVYTLLILFLLIRPQGILSWKS